MTNRLNVALIKHFSLFLCSIILSIFGPSAFAADHSANIQSFYFSDAKFDYYLEKADDGTSNLHVKETLTAIFPETNQNHGIERAIPYKNQAGKNTTIANEKALNLTVLRNGTPENIASLEKENDYYLVRIGNASQYVHGEQVYTLEYDFKNVITEFTSSGENVSGKNSENVAYQELYWDTNGTGWSQKFNSLTASLHLSKELRENLRPEAWCYVGHAGESGQNRCEIEKTDDGFRFKTKNLSAHENLTFDTQFSPDTFTVILQENYFLVVLTILITIISITTLIFLYSRWTKLGRENYRYHKNLFVAPQYSAPKNLSVAEAGILSTKTVKSSYVATLLDLAIKKHIQLIKGEPTKILKADTWKIKVLNLDNLSESSLCVLKILKGNDNLSAGEEFKVEKHTATKHLETLSKNYKTSATENLTKKGLLLEQKPTSGIGLLIAIIIIFIILTTIGGSISLVENSGLLDGYLIGDSFLPPIITGVLIFTLIFACFLSAKTIKYKKYTKPGLDADGYLRGLRLYIDMAEDDRLKFLQSVKGADTSNNGIVKLYEKLLPYACLFGLESSWMSTLNKYYELDDVDTPYWYSSRDGLISLAAFNAVNHSLNSAIVSSASYSSSSSGSGGGFSGGGGGGGGGGGW